MDAVWSPTGNGLSRGDYPCRPHLLLYLIGQMGILLLCTCIVYLYLYPFIHKYIEGGKVPSNSPPPSPRAQSHIL